ncbi:MAG: L-seryl-tRNA(Sec) selenium transferase [Anaerolineaceae bacterium]
MKKTESDLFRLSSVEQILQTPNAILLISEFGRTLVLNTIRRELDEVRKIAKKGGAIPDSAGIIANAREWMEKAMNNSLRPVINATGVILHTNLGRAPISYAAQKAVSAVNAGYNTLEFDLETGKRGARINHIEKFITMVTGAESAFVVCNNAAAVLLCLSTFARRKRVVISRTQMVEIGDGFRIPDVLNQSGARMVEIGTTNKVHVSDYCQALETPTSVVLRVHPSNFKLIGFTSEPDLSELVRIAHENHSLMIDNLGSGSLLDTVRFGLAHEPMVQESVQAGADLVCFSGDKLVGGPQAGIIVGRKDLIQRLRRNPLARAVRADKMCLAGLGETFLHYLREEAEREIPVWKMIAAPLGVLDDRARRWWAALGTGVVIFGQTTVGGGSLPEESLPTRLLALSVPHPDLLLKRLRQANPPVIARIENEMVVLDLRTVFPEQDETVLMVLRQTLQTFNRDGSNETRS